MRLVMKKPLCFGREQAFPKKEFISWGKKTTGGGRREKPDPADRIQKCFLTRGKKNAGKIVNPVVSAANLLKFGTMFLCNTKKQPKENMNR